MHLLVNALLNMSIQGIVYIAVTLDGYIARPDGSIDYLEQFQQDPADTSFADFLGTVDAIVMGRKTFKQVISFGEEACPYGERPMVDIPPRRRGYVSASSRNPSEIM